MSMDTWFQVKNYLGSESNPFFFDKVSSLFAIICLLKVEFEILSATFPTKINWEYPNATLIFAKLIFVNGGKSKIYSKKLFQSLLKRIFKWVLNLFHYSLWMADFELVLL